MAAVVDNAKCSGCKSCIDICPVEAISINNEKAEISNECVDCGSCVDECPNQAISAAR